MNITYIDAQNVHKSVQSLWRLIDWKKFYDYLKAKFAMDEICIFFWYVPKYKKLYNFLKHIGYKIVFKEVSVYEDWTIKGNVDIDIAIQAMKDILDDRLLKAYLVTTDSDFNTLIYEFRPHGIRGKLFVVGFENTSRYLRKAAGENIQPLSDIRSMIEFVHKKQETDN